MKAEFTRLGRMDYQAAWDYQLRVHDQVSQGAHDRLLFVEHDPIFTLGAGFEIQNLLVDKAILKETHGIDVLTTDRGGDVTYHGPGQLTIYPIFDLKRHGQDLHKYLRELEQTMIEVLEGFGLEGYRFPPHTGVWVKDRKVAAIGIKIRKWVSMHGIALNANLSLSPYQFIIPCGIQTHGVTTMKQLLNQDITPEQLHQPVLDAFSTVFGLEFHEKPIEANQRSLS